MTERQAKEERKQSAPWRSRYSTFDYAPRTPKRENASVDAASGSFECLNDLPDFDKLVRYIQLPEVESDRAPVLNIRDEVVRGSFIERMLPKEPTVGSSDDANDPANWRTIDMGELDLSTRYKFPDLAIKLENAEFVEDSEHPGHWRTLFSGPLKHPKPSDAKISRI